MRDNPLGADVLSVVGCCLGEGIAELQWVERLLALKEGDAFFDGFASLTCFNLVTVRVGENPPVD